MQTKIIVTNIMYAVLPFNGFLWDTDMVMFRILSVNVMWIDFVQLTWNSSFIVRLSKSRKLHRVIPYTFSHNQEKGISNLFFSIIIIFYLYLKGNKQYLHSKHPRSNRHKCFSQKHVWAHLFPNLGYSHISLQFTKR